MLMPPPRFYLLICLLHYSDCWLSDTSKTSLTSSNSFILSLSQLYFLQWHEFIVFNYLLSSPQHQLHIRTITLLYSLLLSPVCKHCLAHSKWPLDADWIRITYSHDSMRYGACQRQCLIHVCSPNPRHSAQKTGPKCLLNQVSKLHSSFKIKILLP